MAVKNVKSTSGVVIEGADELLKQFRQMGELAKPVLQKATNAGAGVVKHSALRLVPVGVSGKLRRGIRVTAGRVRMKTRAASNVGVAQKDAFYANFVHSGHRLVRRKNGVKRVVGFVRGIPFLANAVDSNVDRISQAVGDVIAAELDKIARNRT